MGKGLRAAARDERVKLTKAIWVMCLLLVGVFAPPAKADAAVTGVIAPVGTVENAKISATTPGPATLLLLGSGLLGLGGAVRRRLVSN
jgi:hypothetical protein